jgi:hypothetical protein
MDRIPQARLGRSTGPRVLEAMPAPSVPSSRRVLCLRADLPIVDRNLKVTRGRYRALATCLTLSAALSIVFSLAVPALTFNGAALPACQVGILFWRIGKYLASGEWGPFTIASFWWALPMLGVVSLTCSLSLHSSRRFLDPVLR